MPTILTENLTDIRTLKRQKVKKRWELQKTMTTLKTGGTKEEDYGYKNVEVWM